MRVTELVLGVFAGATEVLEAAVGGSHLFCGTGQRQIGRGAERALAPLIRPRIRART